MSTEVTVVQPKPVTAQSQSEYKWLIWVLLVVVVYLLMRQSKISNAETWEWTDYRGIKRSLTIHRDVKQSPG